jgi:hypothetical protein
MGTHPFVSSLLCERKQLWPLLSYEPRMCVGKLRGVRDIPDRTARLQTEC